jgi:hypothetical protein
MALAARSRRSKDPVDIRFVSSLTDDDEDRFAPALLAAVDQILRQFPIAYTIRIETASGKVHQSRHAGDRVAPESRGPSPPSGPFVCRS